MIPQALHRGWGGRGDLCFEKSCERIFREKSVSFIKIEANIIRKKYKKKLSGGSFDPPGSHRVK